MEEYMKALGKTINYMARVYTLGKTVVNMKVSMLKIKNKVLVVMNGLMVEYMMAIGIMVNSMVKGSSSTLRVNVSKDFGKMVKD